MSRNRSIERRHSARSPATRIVVATEGKLTEPGYLKECVRAHCNSLVRIHPIPVGGDPRKVVEQAIDEKEKAKGDSLATRDSFWAMFDRDIHPRFEEARNLAQ